MGGLLQDVRYGARSLLKAPLFTSLTVGTLMLAIGLNSAIFSMLSVVFFTELPVQDPETAVFVWMDNPEQGIVRAPASIPDFLDYREGIPAIEELAGMVQTPGILSGVEQPVRVLIGRPSVNLMDIWSLEPALGRGFLPEDGRIGADRVAMLGHGFWERRFARDPEVIGSEVRIDGYPTTIVGVMDPRMEFGDLSAVDVWMPLIPDPSGDRQARNMFLTGRLAPGATLEQAQAQAERLSRSLAEEYPETNRAWVARVVDFRSGLADSSFWAILLLLSITVGLVMLIACSNVATMTLARAAGRRRELAVRAAVGARRGRILRQLIVESLILSVVSGALGLLVARGALAGLTWLGSGSSLTNFFDMLTIDRQVLLFTLAASLAAPLLFGLIPAIRASRTELADTLKAGGRGASEARGSRGRRVLVGSQVALAVMLMIVAGLMIRALVDARSLESFHEPDSVLTMRVDLPEAEYPEMEQVREFRSRLLDRVQNGPGVVRAAWVSSRPVADLRGPAGFQIVGAEVGPDDAMPSARYFAVSPAYFDIMRLRPLSGRLLSPRDRSDGEPVAVVNAEAVERYWGGRDAVQSEIRVGEGEPIRVVGVSTTEVFPDLANPSVPIVYIPMEQFDRHGAALLVEAAGDPLALTPFVRQAVLELDPEQPIDDVRTQSRILSDGLAAMDAITAMLGAFAFFALVMAAAGIYGVLSFMVASRNREIGVRMALGASRRRVRSLVLRHSGWLIVAGVAVGLTGALGLSRVLASILPEMNPTDPVVFGGVGLILLGVAAIAAWIPARRATRVEPVVALEAD